MPYLAPSAPNEEPDRLYNRLKINTLLMAKIDRTTRYGIGFSLEMMDVEEARYFTERADAALYQVKGRGRDRADDIAVRLTCATELAAIATVQPTSAATSNC